jgi:two-component system, NtrC family, response regulator
MSERARILILDDDASVLVSLALLLKQSGFEAICCDDPSRALALLAKQPVDLLLQDMNFSPQTSGEEGLALLSKIHSQYPALPVLLMTAWGSIALAVKAVKLGAADFFTKPWNNAQLVQLIHTTLQLSTPVSAVHINRQSLDQQYDFRALIGTHPELLKVLATVARVANTRASVLILGESGTGKELIADAIHRNSARNATPMVRINMGAITSSLFESEMFGHVKGAFTDAKTDRRGHFASAHGSTLFLDEIGELQRSDQAKLLRVLQDQHYQPVGSSRTEHADARIISASNRELAEAVAQGEFREDLFYRLNLITLRLPALRERKSDIALIATQLIRELAQEYALGTVAISANALTWLSAQPWPGNVRQLKQCLERTLLLAGKSQLESGDFVTAEGADVREANDAPVAASSAFAGRTLEQVERQMIEHVFTQHQGNISRIAKALGLSRTTLYRRLERHGLSKTDDEIKADEAP